MSELLFYYRIFFILVRFYYLISAVMCNRFIQYETKKQLVERLRRIILQNRTILRIAKGIICLAKMLPIREVTIGLQKSN